MKEVDLFIGGIVGFIIGVIFTLVSFATTKPIKPKKVYPVRVELYGETWQSTFDCDSANLNYAWKDGVRIQIKNVYEIKFN